MKLNGKKFGIEIEFYVPRNYDTYTHGAPISHVAAKLKAIGIPVNAENRYLSGAHHARGDYRSWMLGTDSSLTEDYGQGLELATPPLSTEADVALLKQALKVLVSLGCKVGAKCGLHVHHEVDMRTFDVDKMIRYIVPAQPVLHGILKRSRQNNMYCPDWTESEARRKNDRADDRRKFVNFLPFYNREPHIEFRAHHGSLKFSEIMNWVQITQRIVEVSQKSIDLVNSSMPEEISDLLGQPRTFADLKRRLENHGHQYDDETLKLHLKDAQQIDIAGNTFYFLSNNPQAKLARQLKLERPLTRYMIGKAGMKKEFGDV